MKPKYHQTLQAIRERIHQQGYPPSLAEIAADAGLGSASTAGYHVRKLAEIGYIKTDPHTNRSIRLTEEENVSV